MQVYRISYLHDFCYSLVQNVRIVIVYILPFVAFVIVLLVVVVAIVVVVVVVVVVFVVVFVDNVVVVVDYVVVVVVVVVWGKITPPSNPFHQKLCIFEIPDPLSG